MTCLVSIRCALLSFLLCLVNFAQFTYSHTEIPLALLVSLDGFRWDYLNIMKQQGYATPNFDRLISNGVVIGTSGLKNTFLTKTFPNHFTLVTGLYEENHGIVANSFYDPEFNETFDISNTDAEDRKWWDGKSTSSGKGVEPIWITNERMGSRRVSGAHFWPGSVVDNQRPFYTRCYSKDANFTLAVDTLVGWFVNEVKPINLGLIYFNEPDHSGHQFGAASTEVLQKIVELDGVLGHLLDSLEKHSLLDRMNIIVTSDHGMVNLTDRIYLSDLVKPELYKAYGSSPVLNIQPVDGKEEEVYQAFKKDPRLLVYRKDEIPEDYHYRNNRRIQSIVISTLEGFDLCPNHNVTCNEMGDHGYNNSLQSMHPIFIAHGPAFKKNFTSPPFNNVDVYPLMCHVLGIQPHPNDGNLDNVKQILLEEDHDEDGENISMTMVSFLGAVGLTAFVSGICCIAACRSHRIYIRKNGQFFRRMDPNAVGMSEARSSNKQPLLASEDEDFA